MAILTKNNLIEALNNNTLIFDPPIDAFQLQPAAIDIRVGWSFYIPHTWKLTENGREAVVADYVNQSSLEENFRLIKLQPKQYFEILPGESVVASTLEKIHLNAGNIAGILHPRSSSSRRALSIESGVIDPYYSGNLIIPIRNNSVHSLKIYPGERVCQIVFYELKEDIPKKEAGKHGVQEAKYHTATPYSLGTKPDSKEEVQFIQNGTLQDLKQSYTITTTPKDE